MNLFSVVAFILAGGVLVFGIFTSDNVHVFLNSHAFLIVIGGTLAAASISFQIDRLFLLFKTFFQRVIRGHKEDYVKLIQELMVLAEARRTQSPEFERLVEKTSDPFLKEAMGALLDDVLDHETLIRVLKMRVSTNYQRQEEEMFKFRTVGKYPPAFGLMGTTLSMITLLEKLGQPGGQKMIGPSMAIGLVATFYGLALANLIFNPISENLHDGAKQARVKNYIIIEGIRLIMQNTNPVVLAEELNSFLLPEERIDWKSATGFKKAA